MGNKYILSRDYVLIRYITSIYIYSPPKGDNVVITHNIKSVKLQGEKR